MVFHVFLRFKECLLDIEEKNERYEDIRLSNMHTVGTVAGTVNRNEKVSIKGSSGRQ